MLPMLSCTNDRPSRVIDCFSCFSNTYGTSETIEWGRQVLLVGCTQSTLQTLTMGAAVIGNLLQVMFLLIVCVCVCRGEGGGPACGGGWGEGRKVIPCNPHARYKCATIAHIIVRRCESRGSWPPSVLTIHTPYKQRWTHASIHNTT